jgi:hypothetical protein
MGFGVALGIALTLGLLASAAGLWQMTRTSPATSGLVELPSRAPAATAAPSAPAAPPSAVPSAAVSEAVPSAAPAVAPSAERAKPERARRVAGKRRKAANAASDDLIAPDYAR